MSVTCVQRLQMILVIRSQETLLSLAVFGAQPPTTQVSFVCFSFTIILQSPAFLFYLFLLFFWRHYKVLYIRKVMLCAQVCVIFIWLFIGEDCIAAGTEEISLNHHVCTKHLQLPKSSTHNHKNSTHHVNVNWCFCCSKVRILCFPRPLLT